MRVTCRGDRHRDDSAQHRGPEGNNEVLVRLAEDNEFITRLHTSRLQRAQQRCRTIPEFRKAQAGLVCFAINEADPAVLTPCVFEKVNQRRIEFHTVGVAWVPRIRRDQESRASQQQSRERAHSTLTATLPIPQTAVLP